MVRANIIFIGGEGVGKSALCCRIVFQDYHNNPMNIGEMDYVVEEDNRLYEVEFRDHPAGMDDYFEDDYYRSCDGFLCVFSLTDRQSLKYATNFRYRIERVKKDDTAPFVLVGNKADLVDKRVVSREEAARLAATWDVPYFETSAKTDYNVTESLSDLMRQIRKRQIRKRQCSRKRMRRCNII